QWLCHSDARQVSFATPSDSTEFTRRKTRLLERWLCHSDARQVSFATPSDSTEFTRRKTRLLERRLCHSDARQVSDLPGRLPSYLQRVSDPRFCGHRPRCFWEVSCRQVRDLP